MRATPITTEPVAIGLSSGLNGYRAGGQAWYWTENYTEGMDECLITHADIGSQAGIVWDFWRPYGDWALLPRFSCPATDFTINANAASVGWYSRLRHDAVYGYPERLHNKYITNGAAYLPSAVTLKPLFKTLLDKDQPGTGDSAFSDFECAVDLANPDVFPVPRKFNMTIGVTADPARLPGTVRIYATWSGLISTAMNWSNELGTPWKPVGQFSYGSGAEVFNLELPFGWLYPFGGDSTTEDDVTFAFRTTRTKPYIPPEGDEDIAYVDFCGISAYSVQAVYDVQWRWAGEVVVPSPPGESAAHQRDITVAGWDLYPGTGLAEGKLATLRGNDCIQVVDWPFLPYHSMRIDGIARPAGRTGHEVALMLSSGATRQVGIVSVAEDGTFDTVTVAGPSVGLRDGGGNDSPIILAKSEVTYDGHYRWYLHNTRVPFNTTQVTGLPSPDNADLQALVYTFGTKFALLDSSIPRLRHFTINAATGDAEEVGPTITLPTAPVDGTYNKYLSRADVWSEADMTAVFQSFWNETGDYAGLDLTIYSTHTGTLLLRTQLTHGRAGSGWVPSSGYWVAPRLSATFTQLSPNTGVVTYARQTDTPLGTNADYIEKVVKRHINIPLARLSPEVMLYESSQRDEVGLIRADNTSVFQYITRSIPVDSTGPAADPAEWSSSRRMAYVSNSKPGVDPIDCLPDSTNVWVDFAVGIRQKSGPLMYKHIDYPNNPDV